MTRVWVTGAAGFTGRHLVAYLCRLEPRPRLGVAALVWSYLYFAAMIARYVIRMTRRPEQRWLGGTIPIIFHSVVAAFQWTFGTYHASPP